MNDHLLVSKDRKWCSTNSLDLKEWKQIKNEILLVEDGIQLKGDYAVLGDGNHIAENSSLVNLVTVVEGDREMPRMPSEIALLPLKIQVDRHKKIKHEGNINKLQIETEGKFVISTDAEKVDRDGFCSLTNLIVKKCPAECVNYCESKLSNYSTETSSSTASSLSAHLVTVSLDHVQNVEKIPNEVDSKTSKESLGLRKNKSSCMSAFRKLFSCKKKKSD